MRRFSDVWGLGSLILPLMLMVLGAAIAVLMMPVLPDPVQEFIENGQARVEEFLGFQEK